MTQSPPMKPKRDVRALILMAGGQMQQLCVTAAEDEQCYKDLKCHKLSKKCDLEASEEGADFEMMGIGLLGLAKSLSGHGSRGGNGAYDMIPKSQDFFAVSMQWPDRWFRGMYR